MSSRVRAVTRLYGPAKRQTHGLRRATSSCTCLSCASCRADTIFSHRLGSAESKESQQSDERGASGTAAGACNAQEPRWAPIALTKHVGTRGEIAAGKAGHGHAAGELSGRDLGRVVNFRHGPDPARDLCCHREPRREPGSLPSFSRTQDTELRHGRLAFRRTHQRPGRQALAPFTPCRLGGGGGGRPGRGRCAGWRAR
jgi:hypothetical protein